MAGEDAAPGLPPGGPPATPGAAPQQGSLDDFDADMGAVDMDAGSDDAGDDGGNGAPQSLGSMFDAADDPVTGREMDGLLGLPDGGEDPKAEPQEAEDEPGSDYDDDSGEEGEGEQEQEATADSKLLEGLKLDEVVGDDLMERLKIKQTINGEEREVTLAEAAKNGMREIDYSRGKRELADAQGDHKDAVSGLMQLTEGWKVTSPQGRANTRRQLERLGVPLTGKDSIGMDIANEYVSLQDMTEGERSNWERANKAEASDEESRARLQQLEAQGKKQKRAKQNSGIKQRVEGWRDAAFKTAGTHISPLTKGMFQSHLGNLWDRSKPITEAVVREAAAAASQEWAERAGAHQAAQESSRRAAKPKPKMRPRSAPSAGGNRQRANGSGAEATLDNFDAYVRGRQ